MGVWDDLDRLEEARDSVRRADLYPDCSLDGKRNFKRFSRIERDGTVTVRVHLDVSDPAHREELICIHYLKHLTKCFLGRETGVRIEERDDPWDFSLALSSGESFYVEITSIADSRAHFEINKREERLARWRAEDEIPLHELVKLQAFFPDVKVAAEIEALRRSGFKSPDVVPNPLSTDKMSLFVSSMVNTTESLTSLIEAAIQKKATKRHSGKKSTVLIVDNRTSQFDLADYREAARSLASWLATLPFPEIWFYTGYCSDNDGNNAEFSFAPLKITDEQIGRLGELVAEQGLDSKERLIL